ncbi:MAG: ferredoxin reductase family protein [Ornithinimicrobium sp.]
MTILPTRSVSTPRRPDGLPVGVGEVARAGAVRSASAVAFWLLNAFVLFLWVDGGGVSDLANGQATTSLGRLSGLVASSLLLVQVFLMARIPALERSWGQHRLTAIHRTVGFTSFWLMAAHIATITIGYAGNDVGAVWSTLVDFVLNYAGMLLAVAGTLSLFMVVATSIRAARRRMRYQSWHLLHLYAYLGAGLALPHQLWTGQEFLRSTTSTVFWWAVYAAALVSVLVWRLGLPAWRSARHRIRVHSVETDPSGVTTVTMHGHRVHDLRSRSGQFFQFRFLDGPGWSRAHPFSLSASPKSGSLRISAAPVGPGSRRLQNLHPGTRVLIEGPYGILHEGVRTQRKVLLMAAGIGIAPLRGLLEDMEQEPDDITVIHRVSTSDRAALRAEVERLTHQHGARYVVAAGPRNRHLATWLPASEHSLDPAQALLDVVPDLAAHDVYLCGSGSWMDLAQRALLDAGLPPRQLHREDFSD